MEQVRRTSVKENLKPIIGMIWKSVWFIWKHSLPNTLKDFQQGFRIYQLSDLVEGCDDAMEFTNRKMYTHSSRVYWWTVTLY
jgi:hypothetical protein